MKTKMNIKSIILMSIICISSVFFINISFASTTAKIAVETARLREEPNTTSKILELASQGEEVELIENNGEWCKVKYKKIIGYLRTDLLEIKNSGNEQKNNTVPNNSIEQNSNTQNIASENNTIENNAAEEPNINETTEETNTTPIEENVLGKYKVLDKVTLKILPLINSLDIRNIEKDTQLEVTEIINNWAYSVMEDGTQGWIRTEKLEKITAENKITENKPEEKQAETANSNLKQTAKPKTMYVNSQTINLREVANTTSKVIAQLSKNTEVKVISTENGWHYVETNGKKGYIAEGLLSTTKSTTSRSSLNTRKPNNTNNETNNTEKPNSTANTNNDTNNNTGVSGQGNNIVSYAKQFLGCKYVYGGTTPKGFDCSGFTQYVYKNFGINLNRTAAAQYSNGRAVTSLQAGDLVMFGKSGINHVGIYIGGNKFIHAANPSRGVTIDTLASGYYKNNYVGARRIF